MSLSYKNFCSSISSFHGSEELVSELKSVQSELMSKIENLDHSAQSIVEALPPLPEMEVTVILPL